MASCGRWGLVVVTARGEVSTFADKFAFELIHLLSAV